MKKEKMMSNVRKLSTLVRTQALMDSAEDAFDQACNSLYYALEEGLKEDEKFLKNVLKTHETLKSFREGIRKRISKREDNLEGIFEEK